MVLFFLVFTVPVPRLPPERGPPTPEPTVAARLEHLPPAARRGLVAHSIRPYQDPSGATARGTGSIRDCLRRAGRIGVAQEFA
jgi:hypothetical protein